MPTKFKLLLFSLFLIVGLATTQMAYGQYEDQETANSRFYYSGYAGTEKIELNLQVEGLIVFGSYIIKRTGDIFIFRGRLSSDRSGLGVLVFDDKDQYKSSLEAKVFSEENSFAKEIKGRLKSADGKKSINISLTKTAELAKIFSPATSMSLCFGQ